MKALSSLANAGLTTFYGSSAMTATTWAEAALYGVAAVAYAAHLWGHRRKAETLPEMDRNVDVRNAGERVGRGSMWL